MKEQFENRKYAFPEKIDPADIKSLRKKLKLTQAEMAEALGTSKPTYVRWENGNVPVNGTAAILMDLWLEKPELLEKKKIPQQEYPLRICYMLHDKICAVIDVDEKNRKICLNNMTDVNLYRPFGINTAPTYEDYEEFLESRCFPRSRDKMKLQLKELDLPFYDPFMIIEKTEGRMAEDEFWLKIIRKHQ